MGAGALPTSGENPDENTGDPRSGNHPVAPDVVARRVRSHPSRIVMPGLRYLVNSKFGDQLTFHGGIDIIKTLLRGTKIKQTIYGMKKMGASNRFIRIFIPVKCCNIG